MVKISIIIPIYNVEQFLDRCLSSVLNQSLKEIEIILINDGSTDNSQDIIDFYVNKYPLKIRAFYKTNGGLSSARNFGLEHVRGEYIGFVDSDDWIEPEMYEEMFKVAKINDSDIVCCGYKEIYQDRVSHKLANLYQDNKFHAEVVAWNKIYKASFWKKYNFRYFLNIYHEDAELFPLIFSATNKIIFINDEFMYNYNKENTSSIIYNNNMHMPSWYIICKNHLIYYNKKNISEKYINIFCNLIIYLTLETKGDYKFQVKIVKEVYSMLINSPRINLKYKALILFSRINLKLTRILYTLHHEINK